MQLEMLYLFFVKIGYQMFKIALFLALNTIVSLKFVIQTNQKAQIFSKVDSDFRKSNSGIPRSINVDWYFVFNKFIVDFNNFVIRCSPINASSTF